MDHIIIAHIQNTPKRYDISKGYTYQLDSGDEVEFNESVMGIINRDNAKGIIEITTASTKQKGTEKPTITGTEVIRISKFRDPKKISVTIDYLNMDNKIIKKVQFAPNQKVQMRFLGNEAEGYNHFVGAYLKTREDGIHFEENSGGMYLMVDCEQSISVLNDTGDIVLEKFGKMIYELLIQEG